MRSPQSLYDSEASPGATSASGHGPARPPTFSPPQDTSDDSEPGALPPLSAGAPVKRMSRQQPSCLPRERGETNMQYRCRAAKSCHMAVA
eukprot:scaffold4195_cov92-Isochrysis_galbana.AAC.2